MVSPGECSINIVNPDKPKLLTGLLHWAQGVNPPLSWTSTVPVKRADLTYSAAHTEHGKSVLFPQGKADRKER